MDEETGVIKKEVNIKSLNQVSFLKRDLAKNKNRSYE